MDNFINVPSDLTSVILALSFLLIHEQIMAFVHELRSVIKTLSLLGLKNMLWILKPLFLWQALSCPFFSRGSRSPGAQLLELVQSVMYFCRQGIYIWKGVSKLQVVIVFSAKKKKRVLLKLWQLCLVMEDNLPPGNNGSIYLYHTACSGGVRDHLKQHTEF